MSNQDDKNRAAGAGLPERELDELFGREVRPRRSPTGEPQASESPGLASAREALSRWAGERAGGAEAHGAAIHHQALGDDAAPAPSSVRQRLLATVRGPERFRPFFEVLRAGFGLDDDNLRDVLARIDSGGAWQAAPFPDVAYFHFPVGPTDEPRFVEAGVVRVRAGATFPRHRHLGPERVLILEGVIEDGPRINLPGDIVEMEPDTEHDYRAGVGRDLLLVSIHGGVEFLP